MHIRSILPGLALGIAVLAIPASASAAEGFARTSGVLRAGPGTNYPSIVYVPRGSALEIYGCLARYSWCDVSFEGDRGWFPGRRIAFVRDGRNYSLAEEAAILGLSILTFDLTDYWGSYYLNRPWYNQPRWRREFDRHRLPPGGNLPPPPPPKPPHDGSIKPPPFEHKPPPLVHKPPKFFPPSGQMPKQQWQQLPNQGKPKFQPDLELRKRRHCVPPEVCQ